MKVLKIVVPTQLYISQNGPKKFVDTPFDCVGGYIQVLVPDAAHVLKTVGPGLPHKVLVLRAQHQP